MQRGSFRDLFIWITPRLQDGGAWTFDAESMSYEVDFNGIIMLRIQRRHQPGTSRSDMQRGAFRDVWIWITPRLQDGGAWTLDAEIVKYEVDPDDMVVMLVHRRVVEKGLVFPARSADFTPPPPPDVKDEVRRTKKRRMAVPLDERERQDEELLRMAEEEQKRIWAQEEAMRKNNGSSQPRLRLDSAATENPAFVKDTVHAPLRDQLVGMGFPLIRVEKALYFCENADLPNVVQWLTDHAEDVGIDIPLCADDEGRAYFEGTVAEEAPTEEQLKHEKEVNFWMEEIRRLHRSDPRLKQCYATIKVYAGNAKNNATDPKYLKIKKENKAFIERVAWCPAAIHLLKALGFKDTDDFYAIQESSADSWLMGQCIKLLDHAIEGI